MWTGAKVGKEAFVDNASGERERERERERIKRTTFVLIPACSQQSDQVC